jgi:hypothetical protein
MLVCCWLLVGMTDQNTGNSLYMEWGYISCFVPGIIREWMVAIRIAKKHIFFILLCLFVLRAD